MGDTQTDRADQTRDAEQHDAGYYLPATARTSSEPGRVERILKTIFRRRGEKPVLVRR